MPDTFYTAKLYPFMDKIHPGKTLIFKTPQSVVCIVDRLAGKEMDEEIAAGEAEYPLPQYSLPAAVEKDRPALRILVPE